MVSNIESADLFLRDYAILKKMGPCYKLVKCNEIRRPGYEECTSRSVSDVVYVTDRPWLAADDPRRGHWVTLRSKKYLDYTSALSKGYHDEQSNEEKLRCNISRARNKIMEYGLCNHWDYFCTLTLDKTKYDRHDLPEFIKHLGIWIQNVNARSNANIKYLLIPEKHKDGAWHLHGFFKGIPDTWLQLFNPSCREKLPPFIVKGIKKGRKLFDCKEYRKRFGYCCFEPIRDAIAATMYMTKYISKDISSGVRELGAHLYYCSKGLNHAQVIARGQWLDGEWDFGYTHTYGSSTFYTSITPEMLQDILDRIGDDPITLADRRVGYKTIHGWRYYYDPDTGEIISPQGKEVHDYVADSLWNSSDDRELLARYETYSHGNPETLRPSAKLAPPAAASAAVGAGETYRQMSMDDLYDLM